MTDNNFITDTALAGVCIIARPTHGDTRGFFHEVYRQNDLDQVLGFPFIPVQANHSRSSFGTVRGIHLAPWHKLVSVLRGEVQQVVSDLRLDSPTFGQHVSINISEENRCGVFVPAGCGNSFMAVTEVADYMYLVTDYWAPGKEQAVIYNDPDLNIAWQTEKPLLSDKDLENPTLRQLFPDKF